MTDPSLSSSLTPPAPSWVRQPDGDETLAESWLLRLRRERFRSRKTGAEHDFFVVHLADAVNVIALTPDRQVILVDQFRAGSGKDSLEPPGGLLDPGEDPLEAGARELLEETGFEGDPPILLGTVWSCPSLLTSRISTIVIANARKVAEPKPDINEEVRLELVPAREVPRLIRNGRIGHALAVQGLLWWLIAELPDSPLALPDVHRPRPRQVHLKTVMVAIAVIALALSALRAMPDLPVWQAGFVLFLASLPVASMVVWRLLDPPPTSALTRETAYRTGPILSRALATVGVAAIWMMAAGFLFSILF